MHKARGTPAARPGVGECLSVVGECLSVLDIGVWSLCFSWCIRLIVPGPPDLAAVLGESYRSGLDPAVASWWRVRLIVTRSSPLDPTADVFDL